MKMAIGINLDEKKGGNFLPVIKFDAKAGDFIVVNREPQSDGSWEKTELEMPTPFKFVADFENLEVGWCSFKPGAVDFTMAKIGEKMPVRPTPDHKQGIRCKVFLKEHGLREFAHTSKNVLRAFDTLHDEYARGAEDNAGKLPVIEVTGTETVKMQTKEQGELRFKVPKWRIAGWVAPPAEFSGAAAPVSEPEKPAPKAMPKPKPADDDEF
jgi:hypothetical protein